MSSSRLRHSRILAAATLLGAVAGLADARNYGRASSPHEVIVTSISPEGDEDLFVFQGGPGFKVSAKARRAKGATLAPVLDLLAPDGTPVPGILSKASASAASMSSILPEGGLFGLRLRGASGTGGCTVSWKLRPARFPAVRAPRVHSAAWRAISLNCSPLSIPAATLSWLPRTTATGDASRSSSITSFGLAP